MFQQLTDRFDDIFRKLRGHGKLTEENIAEAVREVRRALLEADVNLQVAKDFVEKVQKKAIGVEVARSITPAQQMIKVVFDELRLLIGGNDAPLREATSIPPTVVMIVGLQGTGKTTFASKLAKHLKARGRKPLLVAADLQRPAAIKQLEILAKSAGVHFFSKTGTTPLDVCKGAITEARQKLLDIAILDTAGRLHLDDELMAELVAIKKGLKPQEILFVADGMTGQDAVNTAQAFQARLDFTGVVLTKMDGDARGGAALSIKAVTGKPIKYISTGEKLEALEKFHPDRIASRILGMGDVVSLVEKAQQAVDQEKLRDLERKLRKAQFTLEDFYDQLQQIKKMGSLGQLVDMIPGLGGKMPKDAQVDERALVRTEAIIQSMTQQERQRPQLLNGSRRKRIANGSGTSVQEVNRLLKQYDMMKKMMKRVGKKGFKGLPF